LILISARQATEREQQRYECYPMKREYDFSKAERGKLYRLGAKLNMPIYLDEAGSDAPRAFRFTQWRPSHDKS
jgi:hypothetical protein